MKDIAEEENEEVETKRNIKYITRKQRRTRVCSVCGC